MPFVSAAFTLGFQCLCRHRLVKDVEIIILAIIVYERYFLLL
jgi:hypothetical protein